MFCANTVFNQLTQSANGTNRLMSMTGAKHLAQVSEAQSVSFKLPKATKGINYIKITLNSMDIYDVEFGKVGRKADPEMKALGVKIMVHTYNVKTTKQAYAEDLKGLFENETGLYLSL